MEKEGLFTTPRQQKLEFYRNESLKVTQFLLL